MEVLIWTVRERWTAVSRIVRWHLPHRGFGYLPNPDQGIVSADDDGLHGRFD